MTDDNGWARVGPAMKIRMRERHTSKNKLVREGHVDWGTVDKLLAGEPVREQAQWRVATYLGWRGDAFDRIRRGEPPVEANRAETPTSSDLRDLLGVGGQLIRDELDDLARRLRALENTDDTNTEHPVTSLDRTRSRRKPVLDPQVQAADTTELPEPDPDQPPFSSDFD